MKDVYGSVFFSFMARQQAMVAKLADDFSRYIDDREQVKDEFSSFKDDRGENVESGDLLEEGPVELEMSFDDPTIEECDDGKHYYEDEIDIDDPRFWGGMELGLPASVWIGNGFGRGTPDNLLSPLGGLFHEPYGGLK